MKFPHRPQLILGLSLLGVSLLGLSLLGLSLLGFPFPGATFVTSALAADSKATELATIDREAYSVEVGDVDTTAGAAATVEVTIRAKAGHKVNAQYPHKLKVEEVPDGLQLEKKILKKDDGKLVDAQTFVFELPVKATRAGTFILEAKLKTSVCNDQHCLIKKETIQATINAR